MKRIMLPTVCVFFVLSVFVVGFICLRNADFTTFAQSDTIKNANCANRNKDREDSNSANKSQDNVRCDFSEYKTLKVSSLKIESLPQPAYPPEANEKKLKGCVPVKILVDEKGNVAGSCAIASNRSSKICSDRIVGSLFEQVSEDAATKAKFDVSRLSLGSNKYFEMTIVYRFTPSK